MSTDQSESPPTRIKNRRGCLWIGLGVAAVLLMLLVTLFAGGAYYAYNLFKQLDIQTQPANAEDAEAEFTRARARFAGQAPLIAGIDDDGQVRLNKRTSGQAQPIEALQVLAYEPDERHLLRFRVPFWLLRLAPESGRISLGDDAPRELRDLKITVKDFEDFGHGLILDHSAPNGDRVLVWAE
jgi:hypothetical protein